MPRKDQIIKIKIAQKQCGISEDNYRDMLSGFGAVSSVDLSDSQADELIENFKKFGFKLQSKKPTIKENRFGSGKQKYNSLGQRDGLATPGQLRKIESLWRITSESKSDESLRKFVKKNTGVDDIIWITRPQANNIIQALLAMGERK